MPTPVAYRHDTYPTDPESDIIVAASEQLQWTSCPPVDVHDPRFALIPINHLRKFKDSYHYLRLNQDDKEYYHQLIASDVEIFSNREVDLTRRSQAMEELRARIPSGPLLDFMLKAIVTGSFPDGQELKSKDRVQMMLKLFDKSVPDAKSLDAEIMSENARREKAAAKATKSEELKKLTKEELMQRLVELDEET